MIPNITIVLLTMGRRCAGLIDYTGSNMARITHDIHVIPTPVPCLVERVTFVVRRSVATVS